MVRPRLRRQKIPHEAGLEISHISYEKGCYTGQENLERVRSRGHANRRLTGLQFLDANVPAAGTKLLVPGDPAGKEAGMSPVLASLRCWAGPLDSDMCGESIQQWEQRLDASGAAAEVISLHFWKNNSAFDIKSGVPGNFTGALIFQICQIIGLLVSFDLQPCRCEITRPVRSLTFMKPPFVFSYWWDFS